MLGRRGDIRLLKVHTLPSHHHTTHSRGEGEKGRRGGGGGEEGEGRRRRRGGGGGKEEEGRRREGGGGGKEEEFNLSDNMRSMYMSQSYLLPTPSHL